MKKSFRAVAQLNGEDLAAPSAGRLQVFADVAAAIGHLPARPEFSDALYDVEIVVKRKASRP